MKDFLIPVADSIPDVYFITGENEARYPYSNSLVIGNTLIDTGIPKRVLRALSKEVTGNLGTLGNPTIQKVILSHWHEDHISGNQFISRPVDSPLGQIQFYCHKDDKSTIENVSRMYELYGIVGSPIEHAFKEYFEMFTLKSLPNVQILSDKDVIQAGSGYNLTVIHTPGHSAGHICLYEPRIKLMFVGDIDLSSFGPWYGCLDGDVDQFEQSIGRLLEYDIEIAISSHKGILRGKDLIPHKLVEYRQSLKQRENTLLEWIKERKKATIADLCNRNLVYNKYVQFPEYLQLAERIMIEKHLESMLKKRLIVQNQNRFMLNLTSH